MSTSCTVVFMDEYDNKIFVKRGHDGFPDVVLKDINLKIAI